MKFLSLFSGIDASAVALESLGWECMAVCENDAFPAAVLAHRMPNVRNLGDITKVDWGEFVERSGRPDVIVSTSPCQSFSAAGRRESLDGESGLVREHIRACAEVRSEWFIWENVPNVLGTRDDAFGQVLDALQDIGYVSLAWRVLDARWFGVAQRRKRLFLVGHLGAGGGASAVLLEPHCLQGDARPDEEVRQEDPQAVRGGAGAGRRGVTLCAASNAAHAEICEDVAPTMLSRQYKDPPILVTDLFCAVDDNAKSAIDEDLCGTLKVGGAGRMSHIGGI